MNHHSHGNSLMEANTLSWSHANIQVGLGDSQKIVTGRGHFGRVLPKETQVGQHSPHCEVQLFLGEHLASPPRPPDASQRAVGRCSG